MTSKKLGGFVNETYTVNKLLFLKKTDLCLPLPQIFEKTFSHESKY